MAGMTRGTVTLLGAGAAGLLLWLAAQTDADGLGGYWTWIGLLAGAGLVVALSQLLGGWTKWGRPHVSGPVFLLGFLPALVVGGLVLLHAQPEDGWGSGLAADLGLEGLADDVTSVLPALAFGLGLLFGLTFDTAGPRVRDVATYEPDHGVTRRPAAHHEQTTDEPVAAERRFERRDAATPPVGARTTGVDRDADGIDDRSETQRRHRRNDE